MSWAQRRKLIYIGSIIAAFILFVVLPTIIHLYEEPTCFDGKQNQDELGVDCGGSCALLCHNQYVAPTVLWSRFSKVSDGVYNVLAYIENPNINAEAKDVSYVFKLYDKKGVVLKERTGTTSIPPNKVIAVFEANMQTGYQIPDRVEFSFSSQAVWTKQDSVENNLSISETSVSREDSSPRLSFVLTNQVIKEIKEIEAIGIVYNAEGNTVAFSRTVINALAGKESRTVNFNWPKPFDGSYARSEVILKVLK